MQRRIVFFVLVVLVFSFIAAGIPAPALAQNNSSTLNVAFIEGDPGNLDPHIADTIDEFLVLRNVYEGLVSYDPRTLQPTPQLAEKWEISPDGLIYTFHLRQGVKFHNGRALTAQDVKYSLERLANPNTGKSYTRFMLDTVKGIDAVMKGTATETEGLKVVDDYTFQIILSQPSASLLNQLSLPGGFIIPKEAVEKANFAENPVGTGPYKFVQWAHAKQITLEANADYWGDKAKVQFVALHVVPNSSQQVTDFKAGKLDVVLVPAFSLPTLISDPAMQPRLQEIPALAVTYLVLNLKDPALSKPEVRRALNLAIDRQALIKGVLKGQGQEAQGVIPPLLSAYETNLPFKFDTATARDLLAKAGYSGGLNLTVNLATDQTDQRVLGVIQAQLADVGVNLTINSTDKATFDKNRVVCNGQMFVSTWTGDYADPDDFTTLLIDSSQMRQTCGYGEYNGIADVKALLDKAAASPVGPDRDALYRQAQKIATDIAINIPIYFRSRSALISARLDGAYMDATLGMQFTTIAIKN